MWVGFASRFAAIQRVGRELRQNLLPVYDRLQRPGSQMSVFDTRQRFGEIPMIDTLIARRAVVDSLDGSGGYIDAGTADTRDSTCIELTVFQPKPWYDTGVYRNSRYALITNRRTFPNDTLRYSSRTTALGGDSVGLGFIDARRPVVVFKNTTTVMADSLRLERIGDTIWSAVVAFGQEVALEWLDPGWGHMYRLTPIPNGVSSLGVAFNNAQHAENPSLDAERRPIITVYERDSIVYMRLNHRDGSWSRARS